MIYQWERSGACVLPFCEINLYHLVKLQLHWEAACEVFSTHVYNVADHFISSGFSSGKFVKGLKKKKEKKDSKFMHGPFSFTYCGTSTYQNLSTWWFFVPVELLLECDVICSILKQRVLVNLFNAAAEPVTG
jgi:hypothetical protein